MTRSVMITLLGVPRIDVAGQSVPPPRGRKSWAVLTYLLLTGRPGSRRHLAGLLFPEADDPLGALRWALADLRRALGPDVRLSGDPLTLDLGEDCRADVERVLAGDASYAMLAGELLEGLHLDDCPGFETWLHVERRRLAGVCEALLHEEALRHLGYGRFPQALEVANRLAELNPLEENNQVLLVRCLSAAGERDAALAQVERCHRLFERELGVPPSPAVAAASEVTAGSVHASPTRGHAAALAQLEAGEAAISAGAVEAGLHCLRRAVSEAAAARDEALRIRALIALGSALVHGVRGRDEEGAAVLHEALAGAERTGDPSAAARISRELAFVDVQAGRRERADEWLGRASDLTEDDAELAAVLGIRGMNLSDTARYGDALSALEESIERALRGGVRRQAAWSSSLVGRIHLLRGDLGLASAELDRSLSLVHAERWVAFAPWPESLRADVDRGEGRPDDAQQRVDHAFALACQLGDPCWEGMAARGAGLLAADAGQVPAALGWLEEAETRCTRWPDTYQWVRGHVLDSACEVAVSAQDPRAPAWVDRLAELAARTAMTELVARSHVHRARLGQPGAATAAAQAAAGVDNTALIDLVAAL